VVRDQREPAGPIGLGTSGTWIYLEALSVENASEFDEIDLLRELQPEMVASRSPRGASPFGPPMLVRERASGQAVGVVENRPLPGSVAVFVIYLDSHGRRRGYGFEAACLYISHLFDSGARLVTAEILEFNTHMIGIMRKVGIEPQARFREHVYSAGAFWDMIIYSFDGAQWRGIVNRYRRMLPGGGRAPAAIGGSRLRPRTRPSR